MSQNEEQVQESRYHSTSIIAVEKHEKLDEEPAHNQATSVEMFLPPDVYIAGLQNEESTSLFKRKSIFFTDYYSQFGSFDEAPSLSNYYLPGDLISPCTNTSPGSASPRYSRVFSLNSAEGINVSNLSVDPPALPLSSPPGKPLSPRTSTTVINTDSLNFIPGSNMHLSTILSQLPLAEIVLPESDESNEGTVNESETSQIKNEKCSVDNSNYGIKSVAKPDESHSKSDLNKGNDDQTPPHAALDHLPMLELKDKNFNRVSDDDIEGECVTKDKKQLINNSSLSTENLVSDMHLSFMRSSTFIGSSGYNSDPVVQSLGYFQPSKRQESSSTALTEISNTSDETHVVGNLYKSNSANSLVCHCTDFCKKIMYFYIEHIYH